MLFDVPSGSLPRRQAEDLTLANRYASELRHKELLLASQMLAKSSGRLFKYSILLAPFILHLWVVIRFIETTDIIRALVRSAPPELCLTPLHYSSACQSDRQNAHTT